MRVPVSTGIIMVAVSALGLAGEPIQPREVAAPKSSPPAPSVIAVPNYPSELWNHHVESTLLCAISVSAAGAVRLDDCSGSSFAATMDGPREIEAISDDFVEAIREAVAQWRFPEGAAGELRWEFQFRRLPELGKDAQTLPFAGPVLSEIHLPDRIIVRAKRKEIRRFH